MGRLSCVCVSTTAHGGGESQSVWGNTAHQCGKRKEEGLTQQLHRYSHAKASSTRLCQPASRPPKLPARNRPSFSTSMNRPPGIPSGVSMSQSGRGRQPHSDCASQCNECLRGLSVHARDGRQLLHRHGGKRWHCHPLGHEHVHPCRVQRAAGHQGADRWGEGWWAGRGT
mmetsp:Transcript_34417/g.85287  ORF Transcript_34417/g.85287 Transcript_34417/m.85287 type:complete len:170 (-) Transcript_34417:1244-1753(-)